MNQAEARIAFGSSSPWVKAQVMRNIRGRLALHLYDDSGVVPDGIAIYSLSDPRDVRHIRYIGQTVWPRRRLMQHLCTARPWLPDETPWWVKSPRLRPLYRWIRELYREERRLPVMVICAWVEVVQGRRAEQDHIRECLQRCLPLLNIEGERSADSPCSCGAVGGATRARGS